jgi:hypothetical protein
MGPVLNPPEYEGVILDKWAGYSESETGSRPYFQLLVEGDDGRKVTVPVNSTIYYAAKVGSRIKKSSSGIELIQPQANNSG